jgi:hypothetical protein
MSYDDTDNEFANGGNGRFDGVSRRFAAGGSPRKLDAEKKAEVVDAMRVIGDFFRGEGLNPAILDENGNLTGPIPTLDLLREFKAAKDFKEACDLLSKESGRLYDYLRLALVPERFEEDGISNMKVDGVGRVQLAGDLYAGVIKGKEDQAFEWLDDNGRGDLVKKTVNSSSIKAVLKKMLESGEEIPAELFKAEPFTRASIVKA